MSNIDFQISASNQTTIFDLPNDVMHNQISKYLLEDKQINKVFNEKDDYYLLNMLFGKIWDVKYIIPSSYNEYKSTLNLDYVKNYFNTLNNLNCNSLKVLIRITNIGVYDHFIIKMYDINNKNLGNINMCGGISKNNKTVYIRDQQFRDTLEMLKNEIKEYVSAYNKN